MPVSDQYITPTEMTSLQRILRGMDRLAAELEDITDISVDLFINKEGLGRTFKVRDSNGDVIGHAGYGDSGFVLYLDDANAK
jgi:hypothetical protein